MTDNELIKRLLERCFELKDKATLYKDFWLRDCNANEKLEKQVIELKEQLEEQKDNQGSYEDVLDALATFKERLDAESKDVPFGDAAYFSPIAIKQMAYECGIYEYDPDPVHDIQEGEY